MFPLNFPHLLKCLETPNAKMRVKFMKMIIYNIHIYIISMVSNIQRPKKNEYLNKQKAFHDIKNKQKRKYHKCRKKIFT